MLPSLVSGTWSPANLHQAVGAWICLLWSTDLSPRGHSTGREESSLASPPYEHSAAALRSAGMGRGCSWAAS